MVGKYMPHVGILAGCNRHIKRQEVQEALRNILAWWADYHYTAGYDQSQSYIMFHHRFGIDPLTLQAIKSSNEVLKLAEQISYHIGELENEKHTAR